MAKSLLVVESPAKARTINKFLGSNYVVRASNGHVRDLPKRELGVDIEHDFEPKYVALRDASKTVKALRDAAKKVDHIILATDPDREGEAIGWHVAELLKSAKKPVSRVVFNEITKRAIKDAAQHPREIDANLVDAQQARRVLDRLVGYKVSPLLQFAVRKGLSAGRVQSVAVRMVCEREEAIRGFVPLEYWTLDADLLTPRGDGFMARLNRVEGEKAELPDESTTMAIVADLEGATYTVTNVEKKQVQRRPWPPFTTSTLQQEASRKLGFGPRKTMRVAQQLYEGIDLGSEGSVGVITYMRTDSTRIAGEALSEVRSYIAASFEKEMLPEKPNFFKSKKDAQDAHEAIRPTSSHRMPDAIRQYLDKDQLALYTLIWMRFVACQMAPAVYDQTGVDITAGRYELRATGSVMRFPGFTKLYEETDEDKSAENGNTNLLPEVNKGENPELQELKPEQHFTKPPARYTEATLIRALEENGIGRPSTYAPTINTVQERGYVERERNRLKPTELGEQVNRILVETFPDIFDIGFTASMEDDLDHVEEGTRRWQDLVASFYESFARDLNEAEGKMLRELLGDDTTCETCGKPLEIREGRFGLFVGCQDYPECKTTRRIERKTVEQTDEVCDKCGGPMVIRVGRFGKFMACSNYPECKNTFNVDDQGNKVEAKPKEPPKKTDQKCPECGGFLLIRKSRAGEEFYGCEKYPKCKFTKPMELNLACPREGCDGQLVTKRARRRRFIGCDKYPDCDYTTSGTPDKETACPKCGNGWTTVTKSRNKPDVRRCPVPGCGYEEEIQEDS